MNYQRKENKTEKVTLVVFEWWDFGEFCFLYFYSSVFSKFLYNVCGIIRCLEKKGTNEVHPLGSRKLLGSKSLRADGTLQSQPSSSEGKGHGQISC